MTNMRKLWLDSFGVVTPQKTLLLSSQPIVLLHLQSLAICSENLVAKCFFHLPNFFFHLRRRMGQLGALFV